MAPEGSKVDLILDSGAFSAWKQQETLSVQDYIAFIKRYEDHLWHYVNLDVIPGSGMGHKPSALEVEASAAAGWKNLEIMREAGLKPMPVYHMGERRYWLDKMIDSGYDYIGISPANDRTTSQKQEWLDEVFGYLCGREGYPRVKTHGFGVTALPLLYRYPWFSADSISWILIGGYGKIVIPKMRADGKYDYTLSPFIVYISDRSKTEEIASDAAVFSGDAVYDALGSEQKRYVDKYLESEGFKADDCRNSYVGRLRVNLRFFKRITESYSPQPFVRRDVDLFGTGAGPSRQGSDTNLFGHLRLIYTTTTSREHSILLNEEDCRERLISWYHINNGDKMDIVDYVKTGLMNHVKPRAVAAAERAEKKTAAGAVAVLRQRAVKKSPVVESKPGRMRFSANP